MFCLRVMIEQARIEEEASRKNSNLKSVMKSGC
nr:MAG TPA: hypothetical protein [Caudoviricetes sp.]